MAVRYSVTTRLPGASDVLMCGATFRPASTAFLASRPAASSTLGLEVFVQEVMAAISTSPLFTFTPSALVYSRFRSSGSLLKPFSATGLENSEAKVLLTLPISMRSCGRLGPASDGATVPRSSVSVVL
ncbi:hypothetical protein D3C85_1146120 [compost metagenome]